MPTQPEINNAFQASCHEGSMAIITASAPTAQSLLASSPSGALAVIMNVIWIILPGFELAVFHLIMALLFAITIIGLPLAAQHLKMTRLAILPFGFEVREMRP